MADVITEDDLLSQESYSTSQTPLDERINDMVEEMMHRLVNADAGLSACINALSVPVKIAIHKQLMLVAVQAFERETRLSQTL